MRRVRRVLCLAAIWPLLVAAADLSAALAERNLEKRSHKALENAERALKAAQQAYQRGDLPHTQAALEELRASVELAHRSLQQTGKDPSRSPKHFKHAEIKTRELLRRLDHFRQGMAFDDRQAVEPVRAAIAAIHDDLLLGIMSKKNKRAR